MIRLDLTKTCDRPGCLWCRAQKEDAMKKRGEKITNLPYRLVRSDTTEVTFKTLPQAQRAALRSYERDGLGSNVYHCGQLVFFIQQLELPFGAEAAADRPMTPELRAKVLAQRSEYRGGRYGRTR